MKVRVSEHQGVSSRVRNPVKGTHSASVRDHMLICNHEVAWGDFRILLSKSNKELKESSFIKRDKTTLNKHLFSQELLLI